MATRLILCTGFTGSNGEVNLNRLAPAVLAVTVALAGCNTHEATKGGAYPVQPPQQHPVATQPSAGSSQTTQPVTPPKPEPAKPAHAVKPAPLPPVPSVPAADPIIATVNGVSISREEVLKPLIDAHGLNVLLNVVQMQLARNEAAKASEVGKPSLVATPEEVIKERDHTLEAMFKDNNAKLVDQINDAIAGHRDEEAAKLKEQLRKDNVSLLEQFLAQQKASQAEFMLLMETNANLRKVIEHQLAGKITEENVRTAFNVTYGESIRVRHIQCTNLQEVNEALRRIEAGQPFEKVAEELSRNNRTRSLGGELPAFTRETPGLPDSFKTVAFGLKEPGEVSEPVSADGAYHLIKLIEKVAPKAVKYEDVKDAVRQSLFDRWVIERMKLARADLGQIAMQTLQINDPVLAKQFKDRLAKREAEIRDREQINRELERQREATTQTSPTTAPNAMPVQGAPEVARPPAIQSGSNTPDQPKQPTTRPN